MTGSSETERDSPQLPQRLEAVHPGHHDVEQHEIDVLGGSDGERRRPAVGRQDTVAHALEPSLQRVAIQELVIHHEQCVID